MNLLFNKSSPSNEIRGPLKFLVATRKEISPKSLSNTFTFWKMISLALTIPFAVSKIVSVGKKILPALTSLKSFLDKSDLEAPVSVSYTSDAADDC